MIKLLFLLYCICPLTIFSMQTHKLARQKNEERKGRTQFFPQTREHRKNPCVTIEQLLQKAEQDQKTREDFITSEAYRRNALQNEEKRFLESHFYDLCASAHSSSYQKVGYSVFDDLVASSSECQQIRSSLALCGHRFNDSMPWLYKVDFVHSIVIRQIFGPPIFIEDPMMDHIDINEIELPHWVSNCYCINYKALYTAVIQRSQRPGFLQKLMFYHESDYQPVE